MADGYKKQGRKGRRRKRGRPSKAQQKRAQNRGPTAKDKAHFVFKRRHLIVTREENLSDRQRADLHTMLEYVAELATLRKFVKKIHRLFGTKQSEHQAWCRWRGLQQSKEFQAVPELVQVLELLEEKQFRKMIAFLRGPVQRRQRVRTNNHVERCNRKLRFWEKVRYKWRRRRTLVRFMVLARDQWWKRAFRNDAASCKRRSSSKSSAKAA